MRTLLGTLLLMALALPTLAEDAPKKAMPKTWEKDKPGEKLDGRWPAGTEVMPRKNPELIACADWLDDKAVAIELSGRLYVKVVKDNGDGWVRILDSREGWVRKADFVLEKEAITYWDQVIKADPKDTFAYYVRGSLQRDPAKSLSDFDAAIRLDPKFKRAYFARGLAQRDREKAISDFTEVIRLDPKSEMAYLCRGYSYADTKRHDKALLDFEEALKLDPESAEALSARGDMRAVIDKDYDKAIADYNASLRIRPNHANTIAFRGGLWSLKKEFAKALADCEEAIRLEPEEPDWYISRGFTRFELKQYDKAIADYNTALKLHPKSASALGNKSLALVKLKKPAEALELLEKAIQLDPVAWMYRDLALFRATYPDAQFRDGKKAVEHAKLAIEKRGKQADWEYFAALAAAYAETGEFDLAVAEQKKAIADKHIHPTDKKEMDARLELYKAKKPYRDE